MSSVLLDQYAQSHLSCSIWHLLCHVPTSATLRIHLSGLDKQHFVKILFDLDRINVIHRKRFCVESALRGACVVGAGGLQMHITGEGLHAAGLAHHLTEGLPTGLHGMQGCTHLLTMSLALPSLCPRPALPPGLPQVPGQRGMMLPRAVNLSGAAIQSVLPCVLRSPGLATTMTAITPPQATPLSATPTQSQSMNTNLIGKPQ